VGVSVGIAVSVAVVVGTGVSEGCRVELGSAVAVCSGVGVTDDRAGIGVSLAGRATTGLQAEKRIKMNRINCGYVERTIQLDYIPLEDYRFIGNLCDERHI
jgi:hypothetical protein